MREKIFYSVIRDRELQLSCLLVCATSRTAAWLLSRWRALTSSHPGMLYSQHNITNTRFTAFRIMKSGIVIFLLLSVVYGSEVSLKETTKDQSTQINVTETDRANSETVSIDFEQTKVDRDQNGGVKDARILRVSLLPFYWYFTLVLRLIREMV